MAIRRDVKYPGRWTPANAAFPMGGPKNRTTDTAKDGSYFDREWIADYEAFYQRLMSEAGISANGSSDTAPTSQFYNALIIESTKATAAWWDTIPKGSAFNKNFGSAAGTVCQGNDSRLSNAREWAAEVVSQAEAEEGTATTARKWTAQRVHQTFKKFGLGKIFSLEDLKDSTSSFKNEPTQFVAAQFDGDPVIPDGIAHGYQFKTSAGFGHRLISTSGGELRIFIQRIASNDISVANEIMHSGRRATFAQAQEAISDDVYMTPASVGQSVIAGGSREPINVTSNRAANVIYTNTYQVPMFVSITTTGSAAANPDAHQVRKNASSAWLPVSGKSGASLSNASYIVPKGWQYRCLTSDIHNWMELR